MAQGGADSRPLSLCLCLSLPERRIHPWAGIWNTLLGLEVNPRTESLPGNGPEVCLQHHLPENPDKPSGPKHTEDDAEEGPQSTVPVAGGSSQIPGIGVHRPPAALLRSPLLGRLPMGLEGGWRMGTVPSQASSLSQP